MHVFDVKSLADNNIPLAVLADGRTIARGRWQSTDTDLVTHELDNVLVMTGVPSLPSHWAHRVYGDKTVQTELNHLWAEAHFQERVSGQPLNPAPSYLDWPWHSDKYKEAHKAKWSNRHDRLAPFDHTYPERFWPKEAELDNLDDMGLSQRMGIRFDYGDLNDVVALLQKDPWTRQAFLPVWFPEDTGSTEGQRVPCTIGYHFIRNGAHLDVKYVIRSCDVTRHFRNDAYMAGRLLQWVQWKVLDPGTLSPYVGTLTMFISNLHLFKDDVWRIEQ